MVRGLAGGRGGGKLSAILRAADLLWASSYHVNDYDRSRLAEARTEPGTVEKMRRGATEARAEYARLLKSSAALEALTKAWAARELDRLPRGEWRRWIVSGTIPRLLQAELAGLPESVAALVGEHVADDIDECEICHRRAPVRLLSDSGESDLRCAWGCYAPTGTDPEPDPLLEWARQVGI